MSWIRVTVALLLLALGTATAQVVPLTDATFAENVNSDDSFWFINFYAHWCMWSQKLAPAWKELGADEEVRRAGVRIGSVDCGVSMELCREASIQGYPTMRIISNGKNWKGDEKNYGDYIGYRDLESMKKFALEMQAKLAPHHKPQQLLRPETVNSTRVEAPRFSIGMVLKLLGF